MRDLDEILAEVQSAVRQELIDAAYLYRGDAEKCSTTYFKAETLASNVIGRFRALHQEDRR